MENSFSPSERLQVALLASTWMIMDDEASASVVAVQMVKVAEYIGLPLLVCFAVKREAQKGK